MSINLTGLLIANCVLSTQTICKYILDILQLLALPEARVHLWGFSIYSFLSNFSEPFFVFCLVRLFNLSFHNIALTSTSF